MKRYEAVMGKYAGLPYVETNECSDGRFVLYSEAQAEIERLKQQNDRLLVEKHEFADLVESALPVVDYGGWLGISEELRAERLEDAQIKRLKKRLKRAKKYPVISTVTDFNYDLSSIGCFAVTKTIEPKE